MACGPSPQRVSQEVVIQASPERVWTAIQRFDAMHEWHPMVVSTKLDQQINTLGKVDLLRTLQLNAGGWITQKQRGAILDVMEDKKLALIVTDTSMPFTNYSDQLLVKSGATNHQAIVVWTGRFTNHANAMDAPSGRDNATAVKAVEGFYSSGLAGLKQFIEGNR